MKKILKKCPQIARSDLACEFLRPKKRVIDDILTVYEVDVDAERSREIGKNEGKYLTIETKVIYNSDVENYDRVSKAIRTELKKFIIGTNLLIVGLGNSSLEADSLGCKTCASVCVTRNVFPSKYTVSAITPGVLGNTGIESYEVVKGVCQSVKPDTVIVIDSLCAGSVSRLLTNIQICNSGITPGSGVKNNRIPLNETTLDTKVVSIGIPTVVYASTLIREFDGKPFESDLVVSPKDIGFYIRDCAKIISDALNMIFLE